jgi:recombination protein RecA
MGNTFEIKNLISDVNKEMGSNLLFDLSSDISSNVIMYCPTGSIVLDNMISGKPDGGLPFGRIIEIYSEESVGKTTICGQIVANAQKLGGIGVFFDSEKTFDEARSRQLGIDPKKYIYAESETVEQTLDTIESILQKLHKLHPQMPVVVIWDSVAGTPTKDEVEGEYDQPQMGLHARVLSRGFRKIAGIISKCNALLICINQAKQTIGAYVPQLTTLGGKAVKFHASIRLELKRGSVIEQDGEKVGHHVRVKSVKNKIFRPLLECEIPLLYDSGVNNDRSLIDFLISKEVIVPAGGWYKLTFNGKDYSMRMSQILEKLGEPDFRSYLESCVVPKAPTFKESK